MSEEQVTDFEALSNQLAERKAPQQTQEPSAQPDSEQEAAQEPESVSRFRFQKGETSFEVDEDAEFELMADKKPVRMTLKEMRDRASGDVAIQKRMHELALERKKLQGTYKEFSKLAKDDPLAALDFIIAEAKDPELTYEAYINKLADQASKLGVMNESEKKAWDAERKLKKVEEKLSQGEKEAQVAQRAQEILSSYPEIEQEQLSEMVDAVLSSDDLSAGLETEMDVMDRVEELVAETARQKTIVGCLKELAPKQASNDKFIFALSTELKNNPDYDMEDVREIIADVFGGERKMQAQRTLSEKQRTSSQMSNIRAQGASDFDILAEQLREKRQQDPKMRRL